MWFANAHWLGAREGNEEMHSMLWALDFFGGTLTINVVSSGMSSKAYKYMEKKNLIRYTVSKNWVDFFDWYTDR